MEEDEKTASDYEELRAHFLSLLLISRGSQMAVALIYALHYNSGGHDKIAIRHGGWPKLQSID
jgi:hypothetical protein